MSELYQRYPQLEEIKQDIEKAADLLIAAAKKGKVILVAGNGGSAADSEHIVGELMKSFIAHRPVDRPIAEALIEADQEHGSYLAMKLQSPIKAIALPTHTALSTAFANDVDPHLTFAQCTLGWGEEGGVFWGLSTSGNAKNVTLAASVAKAKGMKILAFTNSDGGELAKKADIAIKVPEKETYKVQELHLPIYHYLCIRIEEELF
ncbi:MAG: SIS domain-containing protein [Sphaerochaeta sp.]